MQKSTPAGVGLGSDQEQSFGVERLCRPIRQVAVPPLGDSQAKAHGLIKTPLLLGVDANHEKDPQPWLEVGALAFQVLSIWPRTA